MPTSSMLRAGTTLLLALWLAGCASTRSPQQPPGETRCEAFFMYVLCLADLDRDRLVDYMYFDDTRDIFMYEESMRDRLQTVLPFHPCAIPMSERIREQSSQLLYGTELGLSERLLIKGKLAVSYRAAQPAVDACNAASKGASTDYPVDEEPFGMDEDWDEGSW